jgi:hypothetical protein
MAESLDLSIQSRRFQCVYQHGGSLIAAFNLLKSLPTVSFASRSDRVVYMETVSKRRISFFSSMSDLFLDAECVSHCSMKAEDVIESFGKAMRAAARAQGNQPQHLVSLYNQVREGEVPLNFTGDIDYIVNKDKYELVISNAYMDNSRQSYSLNLRPWQRCVVNALSTQNDRTVLWVFDYDGNSGKTELSHYLMYKLNYQILKAAEARDVCGMIESNSNGFVFDFARSDVSKINDFFSLIEDLKGRFLISTKYRGSVKTPRSNTVVVFANQLPNLELLSMDRWSFFHPKLG